ncbi:hypothetical protein KbCgl_21680 [Corynebacterium glutamicum]|nr:hypothetical protein KbCgl_21680 [Corynebacterium glutamicum]
MEFSPKKWPLIPKSHVSGLRHTFKNGETYLYMGVIEPFKTLTPKSQAPLGGNGEKEGNVEKHTPSSDPQPVREPGARPGGG